MKTYHITWIAGGIQHHTEVTAESRDEALIKFSNMSSSRAIVVLVDELPAVHLKITWVTAAGDKMSHTVSATTEQKAEEGVRSVVRRLLENSWKHFGCAGDTLKIEQLSAEELSKIV